MSVSLCPFSSLIASLIFYSKMGIIGGASFVFIVRIALYANAWVIADSLAPWTMNSAGT